jgi:hypothetical protein
MSAATETIRFTAIDVTGTQVLEASEVQKSLPAGAVARSIASRMALPDDVPWALRSDATSARLLDDVAIGDQVEQDEALTIFPSTHLAGRGSAA